MSCYFPTCLLVPPRLPFFFPFPLRQAVFSVFSKCSLLLHVGMHFAGKEALCLDSGDLVTSRLQISHIHSQTPWVVPPDCFILLPVIELSDNPCIFFETLEEYFTTKGNGEVGGSGERTRKSSRICITNAMCFSLRIWQRIPVISNPNHKRVIECLLCARIVCQVL